MKKLTFTILTFLMVFCLAQTGSASILYSVIDGVGPTYGLSFDVKNESGSGVIGFDIFFGATDDGLAFTDGDLFSDFSLGAQPVGWNSYLLGSQVFDDPTYFGSEGILASGAAVGGFKVIFKMDPSASYDHLWYVLYDENYEEVETGYTKLEPEGPNVIPEPGTMLLFGFGLLGTAAISRKKRS